MRSHLLERVPKVHSWRNWQPLEIVSLREGGRRHDRVREQEIPQTVLAGPVEDPVDVFDDLCVLLWSEVAGLREVLVWDQERLPGVLVPGLNPVENGVVLFRRPAREDAVPFLFVPELPGLLLVAVSGI